jgi:glutamine amidotransferase
MKLPQIAIIDYGIGNVKSIQNALLSVGANTILTNREEEIMAADGLILPGVGSFPKGMNNLREHKLDSVIRKFRDSEKPLLGICLGMQLLMEEGTEFGITKGLGLIKGRVEKLEDTTQKLPHIAWSHILVHENKKELIPSTGPFYFVHSYVVTPYLKENILATSYYGGKEFCAAVIERNVMGVQFHPEKSGEKGLNLLRTFTQRCMQHEQ